LKKRIAYQNKDFVCQKKVLRFCEYNSDVFRSLISIWEVEYSRLRIHSGTNDEARARILRCSSSNDISAKKEIITQEQHYNHHDNPKQKIKSSDIIGVSPGIR
jgi:hypothetical protein